MVVCAALKLEACEPFDELIVPCFRHHHGYKILHDLTRDTKYKGHVIEGFMLSDGSFMDRVSAFQHALNCGQLSASTRQLKRERNESELYSEDLY